MAHHAQRLFFTRVKHRFPERFDGCSVLDIGSLDINGNNRYLFNGGTYIGMYSLAINLTALPTTTKIKTSASGQNWQRRKSRQCR